MAKSTKGEFSDKAASVQTANDNLPTWDLDTMFGYSGYGSPEFEAEFTALSELIQNFIDNYKGVVGALTGDELAEALDAEYEIDGLAGKVMSYVQLKEVQDSKAHGQSLEALTNRAIELFTPTNFFWDEIKQIDEESLQDLYAESERLTYYKPMLDNGRRSIPHTPSLEIQTYGSELSPSSAWIKLYEDRQVALRFPFEGKDMKADEITDISYSDPDQERRAAAQKVIEKVYAGDAWLNTKVHNELIRLKKVEDKWHNFNAPTEARHFSNNVPPEVVDALETAVKEAYPKTSHRFYALKAKLMGQDHLNIYDRNINVLEAGTTEKISWEEARTIVLDAYNSFSPKIGAIAQKFFDEGWIDAAPGDNKSGGAFSTSGPAQLLNPLVMMNYTGTARDVATLAHELGHGVHQYLAAHKGDALVHTPLTMAETASIFGEMATYKSLLERTENEEERRKLLFDKVNDMINSVIRQISFYDFEKRNHMQYREKGPLSEEDYSRNWVDALQESYGTSIPLDDSYGPVFGFIPHIVSTPFYVYAYAFGDSFVNALYQVYEEGTLDKEEFVDRYTKMLEAGGTYTLDDVKKDYGLDINDPAFWQKGLGMIESMIDELEVLCQPLLDAKNQPIVQNNAPDIGQP